MPSLTVNNNTSASAAGAKKTAMQLLLLCCLLCVCCASARTAHKQEAEVVSMLGGKLLLAPSARRKASAASVCAKTTDRNATVLQSLSKSTGLPVLVHPESRFKVVYCETDAANAPDSQEEGEDSCAMGSNCANVYRWEKALVHPPNTHFMQYDPMATLSDEVLVPVNCLCVLNWATKFNGQGPIVMD